ncbi:membrane protein [Streptomyces humidus]|uniref:Membrane protein n=1 Tax=Streptomyces humidus TaxID=52259 RepID=A0A918FQ67_9ACTN|nr:vitamin K epoxide reductase family protein [Streptomyces humidus]GGR66105.1 membrane protein [Streptomyces humidus]
MAAAGRAGAGRAYAVLLVLAGAAGLPASWGITLDEFKLLEDPGFTPGCSLNPVVSCGSVMRSEQASVFGFPNPTLGLVAYGIVLCVGASLLARAAFPRGYWLTSTAGCLFGIGFVSWLQFESLYRVNALCLWCCLAWVATILAFWYAVAFDVRHGFLPAPAGVRDFLGEFAWAPPLLHIGVVGMLILTRWWSFWTS